MTEPIKLPPDLLAHVLVREGVNKHRARDIEQWMNEQITVAAEQATADLRAELSAMTKRADEIHKWYDVVLERAENAEAERDEARATLDRCKAVNDATAEGWRETQAELDEARAEVERLREALNEIIKYAKGVHDPHLEELTRDFLKESK
jgi:chromosome segregation ATPase